MQEFIHYPVMLNEAVDALQCEEGKLFIDGTLGGGGYSELILKRINFKTYFAKWEIDFF